MIDPNRGIVLWVLRKGTNEASAVMRTVEGFGVELRLLWNGDLRFSQVYRDAGELTAAAKDKRQELEAQGWRVVAVQ